MGQVNILFLKMQVSRNTGDLPLTLALCLSDPRNGATVCGICYDDRGRKIRMNKGPDPALWALILTIF